jgi:glycerol uptake facilitator-like aquaporin
MIGEDLVKPALGSLEGLSVLRVVVIEMTVTFLFTVTILVIANARGIETAHTKIGAINALIVILALYVGINMSAGLSGACLNPAVGFNLITWAEDKTGVNAGEMYLKYCGGPLLGGFLAGAFYRFHAWATEDVVGKP